MMLRAGLDTGLRDATSQCQRTAPFLASNPPACPSTPPQPKESNMIFAAWKAFTALPRGFHYVLLGLALALGLYALHRSTVREAVEQDRAEAQAEASQAAIGAERAANASLRASEAANAGRVSKARQAGQDSDDPLAAIFASLRGE